MKITDVEAILINPKLASRNADQKPRFSGIDTQTIYRVRTDNGIVGYGDSRGHGPLSESQVKGLVGRSPFDFVNANLPMGLMGALYDTMGKHLEVPAYKLMGQKVRDRVPVAAWTRPASPEDLAREVQRAVDEGYMYFKMHTCTYYDVLEQTRAVEDVAPPGFKMHFDFNHNRSLDAVLRLVAQIERSPVMGILEDPIEWRDIEGWRRLRNKTSLPLLMHVPQLGGGPEIVHGVADLYMVGEIGFGPTMRRGFACAEANLSTVIQLTGGTLTKAMAMHLGAVLPNVSHSINLDDQYEEDVTGGRLEVAEGSTPVPETPGLGVEVDETALARIAANPATVIPRHIGLLHMPRGGTFYSRGFPNVERLTGFPEGNLRGIRLEVREDDGSQEFADLYERLGQRGPFLE
ncbi:MAG: enolase C-terminal domain-like protein [Gemmatimonadota bacterium]